MAKILVVDNEESIADLYSMVLTGSQHEAIGVYSGKAALKKIKWQDFDLVITDLQMPKMNGLELATAIRKRKEGVTIVAMTGNVADFDAKELSQAFDAVWKKPIDIKELPKLVAKVLAKPKA